MRATRILTTISLCFLLGLGIVCLSICEMACSIEPAALPMQAAAPASTPTHEHCSGHLQAPSPEPQNQHNRQDHPNCADHLNVAPILTHAQVYAADDFVPLFTVAVVFPPVVISFAQGRAFAPTSIPLRSPPNYPLRSILRI